MDSSVQTDSIQKSPTSVKSPTLEKTPTPIASPKSEKTSTPQKTIITEKKPKRPTLDDEDDGTPILLYPFKFFWKLYDFFFKIYVRIVITLEDLPLWRTVIQTIVWIFKYPILSWPFAAMLATASIPFFGFVTFCIATTIATFILFVIIEGSILSVIAMVLGGISLFVMGNFILISVLFMLSKYVLYK